LRILINSCLFLTHYGCRRLGSDNDSQRERLLKRIAKKKRRREDCSQAESELKAIPEIYGFEQHVVMFDHVKEPSARTGDGGWTVSPHWRKGSWVNQPYGPHQSLRKRIHRKASFVNAHLFVGPRSATTVNMETRQKDA
jgi:hypothetical protein